MLQAFKAFGDLGGKLATREPRKTQLYSMEAGPSSFECSLNELPELVDSLAGTRDLRGGAARAKPSYRSEYPTVFGHPPVEHQVVGHTPYLASVVASADKTYHSERDVSELPGAGCEQVAHSPGAERWRIEPV
jgi:hypothetical protein